MTQIQNRSINQFLQGKSNHSHYNSSLKTTSIVEPYFNKNLFNKASTKISPHFETVHEEYIYNDNKIKTILNQNLRSSNKNYYRINSHNHCEYIANNSSKNYDKNTVNRLDKKSSEIRKNNSPENDQGYYNKTEDNNAMKRAMSNTYKRNNEDTPINQHNQINFYSNRKEDKKRIEIIPSSPSQPILINDNDINNNVIKKKYMQKTFNSRRKKSPIDTKLEDILLNNSINNIHSDNEKRNKQIKNYKSTNIIKNKNSYIDRSKPIYETTISDNDLDVKDIKDIKDIRVKDNYKYHSITVRKNSNINKDEIRTDFQKNYSINSNRIDLSNILNDNLLHQRKNTSPKMISKINRNVTSIDNRKNEITEFNNNYQNYTLFESKNIKQKTLPDLTNKNNNINTFVDSKMVLLKKLHLNTNNYKSTDLNEKDNTNTNTNTNSISHDHESMNLNIDSKKNDTISSFKLDEQDKNIFYGYDSDIVEKRKKRKIDNDKNNNKIKTDYIRPEKKITYIYEGRSKNKQKSLTEINKDLNIFDDKEKEKEKEKENNVDIDNNIKANIKKNIGNTLKKIIKNNPKSKRKNINMSDHDTTSDKEQKIDTKLNNYKREARHNSRAKDKNDKKIKKSYSNFILENNVFTISKQVTNTEDDTNNNIMEICKVNDISYQGNKNNTEEDINKSPNKLNNNIIIIINNADKNKFKKVIKTPKNIKVKNNILDNNNDNNNIKTSSQNINNEEKENNTKNISNNEINNQNNSNNISNNSNNNNIKKNNNNRNNSTNNTKDKKNIKKNNKNKTNISKNNTNKKNIKKNNNNINNNINLDNNLNVDNNINYNSVKNKNENNNINIINNNDINKDINNKSINNNIKEVNIKLNINNKKKNNDKKEEKQKAKAKTNKINNNDNKSSKQKKADKNIKNTNNITNNNEETDRSEPINSNLNLLTKANSINESENNPQDEIIKIETKKEKDSFSHDSNNNDNNINNLDNEKINKENKIVKNNAFNLDLSKKKEGKKKNSKSETSLINRYNNFLSKKERDDSASKNINSSQEKKPDYNNNDYTTEEIQEIKPVIQHNIQRKRPVYTLPPSKKRSISQGKPFNLIHKYYDENFILEDDEEEGFKKYIKYNGDSRSESEENSRNSLCNSNKKSYKKYDDYEEEKNNNDFEEEKNNDHNDHYYDNYNNNENVDINQIKREKEKNAFQRITEEFYNDEEEEPF